MKYRLWKSCFFCFKKNSTKDHLIDLVASILILLLLYWRDESIRLWSSDLTSKPSEAFACNQPRLEEGKKAQMSKTLTSALAFRPPLPFFFFHRPKLPSNTVIPQWAKYRGKLQKAALPYPHVTANLPQRLAGKLTSVNCSLCGQPHRHDPETLSTLLRRKQSKAVGMQSEGGFM